MMRRQSNGTKTALKGKGFYEKARKIARRGISRTKSFFLSKPILGPLLGLGTGFILARIFLPTKD